MARNTQLILLEESNLSRVVDPAAGAGGFATLTDQLCEAAWAGFQEIEREGGLLASRAAGRSQARIAAVAAERAKAIARRKLPLTGASEFPNVHEAKVDVAPDGGGTPGTPAETGRTVGSKTQHIVQLTRPFGSAFDPWLARVAGQLRAQRLRMCCLLYTSRCV